MPDTQKADSLNASTGYVTIGSLILLDIALLALLFLSPLSLLSIIWSLGLLASLPALALIAGRIARLSLVADDERARAAPDFLSWPLWQDAVARLLLLSALIAGLLSFAYLAARYPGLPLQVTFDAGGDAIDRVVTPGRLLLLPLFAFLAWLLNGLLGLSFYRNRNEPALAYLLWGTGLLVQVATLVTLVLTIR
jgi:hypothetical protein